MIGVVKSQSILKRRKRLQLRDGVITFVHRISYFTDFDSVISRTDVLLCVALYNTILYTRT